MNKSEKEAAVVQLNTIEAIYGRDDALDLQQAILALDLNNKECLKLAIENNISEIVLRKIEEQL